MPAPPLVSPSNMYSGPPPPYSYPSSTASSVAGLNGYISPPESRRTSGDDKEPLPSHQQSLPSIHEALGTEQHLTISSLLTKTIPPPSTTHSILNHSPTSPVVRSYPNALSIAPSHTVQSPAYQSHEAFEKPSRPPYSPYLQIDTGASRFAAVNTQDNHCMPMPPSRTASSPVNPIRPIAHPWQNRHSSPAQDQTPRSAPHISSHYTYTPYQPPHSYQPPTPHVPSFDPALQHPNWPCNESEMDRSDDIRMATKKENSVTQAFGETVKRHLDIFDLETSLNEVRILRCLTLQTRLMLRIDCGR